MITAQELRQKYLEFFKSKGHTIIPSASLIPENDPTVLFTTAGMHPLVPYLLGEEHPGGKRLTSCQKCIRTGDIDEVGDDVHLTFFEMLGNWSLGDYWKKEAISWSFEFLTKELSLPIEKLAVTCFTGDNDASQDDESAGIWKSLGIPENRIYFFGKADNWWGPAGQTGPCGPDTEMFYWTGKGEPPDLVTGDNKEGWVEIWNDVFMQYNKTIDGKFEPLKQRNVDTGMGLERTLAVLNGKESVYETELFTPILAVLPVDLETKDKRIVSDHMRTIYFLLSDGIKPSNKDAGYVLRKLMRRVMDYKEVDIQNIFELIVNEYQKIYPGLNISLLVSEFEKERLEYQQAYKRGKDEIMRRKNRLGGKYIMTGYEAFGISSTLGTRVQDILDISTELEVSPSPAFEEELTEDSKKHQELSRTASAGKFKGGLADNSEEVVKMHTATHLLDQALRDVLGNHVEQKGSNINAERLRFDFSHPTKMMPEQLEQVEKIVNEKIKADLPVHFEMLSVEQAKARGAIGLFEDKYAKLGNQVKVYFVGDYSAEICGGPHVEHTGQIGSFKIIKEEAVAAGIRRIKAVVT